MKDITRTWEDANGSLGGRGNFISLPFANANINKEMAGLNSVALELLETFFSVIYTCH